MKSNPHTYFPSQQIQNTPLDRLRVPSRKARKHPRRQIQKLAASITEFGLVGAVIVSSDYEIVAGAALVEAAQELGMTAVPTICASHLNPTQLRKFRIAHNRLAEDASWDFPELRLEFMEIMQIDPGDNLELTGFETPEIDIILQDQTVEKDRADNDQPEPPVQPVTRPGDLWSIDGHLLLCGDAKDKAAYRKLLGAERANLVVSDPPYNVRIERNVTRSGKHREFVEASGEMAPQEFSAFLKRSVETASSETASGALLCFFMDWRSLHRLMQAGEDSGLSVVNVCVWDKGSGAMGSLYRSQHELCVVFKKPGAPHTNNVQLSKFGRTRTNVWAFPGLNRFSKDRSELLGLHPTVKPVVLIAEILRDASRLHDIVLDPFCGSGTTLIAAQKTKRVARCMELDPGYCDVALQRFERRFGVEAINAETGQTFSQQRQEQTRDHTDRAIQPERIVRTRPVSAAS